jgi:hypothetical protein
MGASSKEEIVKLDKNILRRAFGALSACMIAVSAYAYIV